MTKETIRNVPGLLRATARGVALSLAVLAASAGCSPKPATVGNAAQEFRQEIQTKLTMYSAVLAEALANHDRERINAVLHRLHTVSNPLTDELPFFLSMLDNHGVTVATWAGAAVDRTRNYGRYHIVSRVIQKQRPFQSALYLQGGSKVYIVCSPLLKREKVVGVLIIGISDEQLRQEGISEKEFMSLAFTARTGDRP